MSKFKIKNFNLFPNQELRKYQEESINAIEIFRGRALLSLDMGLGKTVVSLVWAKNKNLFPILIIVPASLKIKWQREVKTWLGMDAYIIYGRQITDNYKNEKVIIINYDLLYSHKFTLKKIKFKVAIVDECHRLNNYEQKKEIDNKVYAIQRVEAAVKLLKKIPFVIALSGTPFKSRPIQFFNILNILKPTVFNSYYRFGHRYCDPQKNRYTGGWDFTGSSNEDKLHKILTESVMIRKLKKDVLKELPEKINVIVPLELNDIIKKDYSDAENDIIEYIEKTEGIEKAEIANKATYLAKQTKLRQLAVTGKLDSVLSWIKDFKESDEKLVVVCRHHFVIDFLYYHFENISVKYTGKETAKQKQSANDLFQNDPKIKLIIGNIKSMGEGIDLYAASNICIVEMGDDATEMDQVCDRINRIGQTASSITNWYLVAMDTIEEKEIAKMIDKKRKTVTKIIDAEEVKEDVLLQKLIKKEKEKNNGKYKN